eukprot:gene9096-10739_t
MFIFAALINLLCVSGLVAFDFHTPIKVSTQYKDQLNIKIQGAGFGGCDIILNKGEASDTCWCLWGTLNYSFCAYRKSRLGETTNNATEFGMEDIAAGRCPAVTGETLVCSDLNSLGNCYDDAYSCTVNANGLCHCESA